MQHIARRAFNDSNRFPCSSCYGSGKCSRNERKTINFTAQVRTLALVTTTLPAPVCAKLHEFHPPTQYHRALCTSACSSVWINFFFYSFVDLNFYSHPIRDCSFSTHPNRVGHVCGAPRGRSINCLRWDASGVRKKDAHFMCMNIRLSY